MESISLRVGNRTHWICDMFDLLLLLVWYSVLPTARVNDWAPVQKSISWRVQWPGQNTKSWLAVNHRWPDVVDKAVLSRFAKCDCWRWKDQMTERLKKATQEGVCKTAVLMLSASGAKCLVINLLWDCCKGLRVECPVLFNGSESSGYTIRPSLNIEEDVSSSVFQPLCSSTLVYREIMSQKKNKKKTKRKINKLNFTSLV